MKGEILGFETIGEGRQRRLTAHFSDGTGVVDLVWFQGIKYILGKYKLHEEYIIFGKPTVFNGRINVAHPDVDKPEDLSDLLNYRLLTKKNGVTLYSYQKEICALYPCPGTYAQTLFGLSHHIQRPCRKQTALDRKSVV